MADKDLTIGIQTRADMSGAAAATRSLQEMEDELQQVKQDFAEAEVGSTKFTLTAAKIKALEKEIRNTANATKELGTSGPKANAGAAVLEFSRAFEDAQYGIRGVLNNIPGLIAMLGGSAGLAGVISLVAVAGTQLWERLGGGAKKAEKETGDLLDSYKELLAIYKELGEQDDEARMNAAKASARKLDDKLADIDAAAKAGNADGSLAGMKDQARLQLENMKARVALQTTEAALVTATGTRALELALARQAAIQKILETELQLSELTRTQALNAAKTTLGAAKSILAVKEEGSAQDQAALAAKKKERDDLNARAEQLEWQRLDGINNAIEAAKKENKTLREPALNDGNYELVRSLDGMMEKRVAELEALRPIQGYEEKNAAAQADALTPAIKALEASAENSGKELRAAVVAMEAATRAIERVKAGNAVGRAAEGDKKLSQSTIDQSKAVGDIAGDAVEGIKKSGGTQYPGAKSEAIERVNKLRSDNVPDIEQSDQLAGALQGLANNLTAKDGPLIELIKASIAAIKTQKNQYEALKKEVDSLKTNDSQKR